MTSAQIISNAPLSDLIRKIETGLTADRDVSANTCLRARWRDHRRGADHCRPHSLFRALDAADAAWCARILNAAANTNEPVSRAEAETLFEINRAASERSDDGLFDDLFAKAIVHHAAAASGLPVPPRSVALSPETSIESWAPTTAVGVNIEVLEWIASQMRGTRRNNRTLMRLVATLIGAATLPLAHTLPNVLDFGM
jgi:hypothetical protein